MSRLVSREAAFLRRAQLVTALFAMTMSAMGCISPNTYSTPRTLAPGKISHTVSLESITAMRDLCMDCAVPLGGDGSILPPSYTFRIGATDNADVGLRAAQLGFFGADFKLNLLKSRAVDIAVDPMGHLAVSGEDGQLHLPGIFGFNLGERVSIIATPGISYVSHLAATVRFAARSGDPLVMQTYGWLGRLGVGINLRLTKGFAIQPEATFFRALQPSHDQPSKSLTWMALGIGFAFGAQPSYADDCAAETAPP